MNMSFGMRQNIHSVFSSDLLLFICRNWGYSCAVCVIRADPERNLKQTSSESKIIGGIIAHNGRHKNIYLPY